MIEPVVIVGAGLSGLHAASMLTKQNIECKVLETRSRIGGRVLTSRSDRPELGHFDLGSTWFWPQQESTISNLVKELNVRVFEQYTEGAMLSERVRGTPPERFVLKGNPYVGSYRIKGGVEALVNAIEATIPPESIELDTKVTEIRMEKDNTITVVADLGDGKTKTVSAGTVILAVPPRIVARHITFYPALPSHLMTDLISKPTWMAGQAKVVAIYDDPFWRELGLSGFATSWVGPLQEIHDASPEEGSGALFGFYGVPARTRQELGKDQLLKMANDQLVRLFGDSAQYPSAMLYKDWAIDSDTAAPEDSDPLREFPMYGQPSVTGLWVNKITFAGTESDPYFGGHLEGALRSAERAVNGIINKGSI